MLHVLLVALVKEHGWSDTARTDPTGTEGNVVFLRILMDSLPLLPCNPTCEYHCYHQSEVTSDSQYLNLQSKMLGMQLFRQTWRVMEAKTSV